MRPSLGGSPSINDLSFHTHLAIGTANVGVYAWCPLGSVAAGCRVGRGGGCRQGVGVEMVPIVSSTRLPVWFLLSDLLRWNGCGRLQPTVPTTASQLVRVGLPVGPMQAQPFLELPAHCQKETDRDHAAMDPSVFPPWICLYLCPYMRAVMSWT